MAVDLQSAETLALVSEIMGEGGLLEARIPGYRSRSGQLDLAHNVAAIASRNGVLAVEAPTGIGKSIGAIVGTLCGAPIPPICVKRYKGDGDFEDARRATTIVVATASIVLQEQYIRKDLPALQRAGLDFKYGLYKGKSNYLCLHTLQENLRLGRYPYRDALVHWLETTKTGDRSEFPFEIDYAVWSQLSKSGDACYGKRCRLYKECFSTKARPWPPEDGYYIIVTNHHLVAYGLLGAPMPRHDVLVIDEAHAFAESVRSVSAVDTNLGTLFSAVKPLYELHDPAADDLHAKCQAMAKDYTARIAELPEGYLGPDRRHALQDIAQALVDVYFDASNKMLTAADLFKYSDPQNAAYFENGSRAAVQATIPANCLVQDDARVFHSKSTMKGGRAQHSCALVDPGRWFSDRMFVEGKARPTVVAMSATLAVRGNLEPFTRRLKLPPRTTKLTIAFPFDLRRQCLLVIPTDVPDSPNHPDFVPIMIDKLRRVIELAGGRTLGLFTSWKRLNAARDVLRKDARLRGKLLVQGEGPRSQILQRFRDEPETVLLGVASFWEGVDVPGESCVAVVIDRLPFARPDEPLVMALEERGERVFTDYSLPRAVTAFRQGFGRLIRTVDDYGVVVVLDRRIVTKRYGTTFTTSLGASVGDSIDDVERFLLRRRAASVVSSTATAGKE